MASVSAATVSLEAVTAAAARIAGRAVRTPVVTSRELDLASGHRVVLKCETLQRTGSFKFRGATNAVFSLSDAAATRGVACHSSGNHGAALAAAAAERGVPCVVVAPHTTPQVKVDNIKKQGGEVVLCEPTQQARRETCEAEANRRGATIVHPYDHPDVIAGQGTIGLEFMEQVPDLEAILVPTSGGGMLTGIAVAARGLRPDGSCTVHAVEPRGKQLGEALQAGQRVLDPDAANRPVATICDAMPTRCLGELPWTLAHEQRLVDPAVFSVSDEQVIEAMRFAFETLKLVIEPAAATGLAALLNGQVPGRDRRIGVVLCGGNVDVCGPLPWQKAP